MKTVFLTYTLAFALGLVQAIPAEHFRKHTTDGVVHNPKLIQSSSTSTSASSSSTSSSVSSSATSSSHASRATSSHAPSHSNIPTTSSIPASSSKSSASSHSKSSSSAVSPSTTPMPSFWIGGNSYYLHTFNTNARRGILNAMQSVGMKTVRVFISHVNANNKGSDSTEMNDCKFTHIRRRHSSFFKQWNLTQLESMMIRFCKLSINSWLIACREVSSTLSHT